MRLVTLVTLQVAGADSGIPEAMLSLSLPARRICCRFHTRRARFAAATNERNQPQAFPKSLRQMHSTLPCSFVSRACAGRSDILRDDGIVPLICADRVKWLRRSRICGGANG